jgi:hypothetical protein
MAKHHRAAEDKSDKKGRPETKLVIVTKPAGALASGLAEFPAGPIGAADGGTIQAQAAQLGDLRLQSAQRQALAAQIGRVQGNQHLQRVVASLKRGGSSEQTQSTCMLPTHELMQGVQRAPEIMRTGELETRGAYWERSMRALPPLRERRPATIPATPASERYRWRTRVEAAIRERRRIRRARAYLQLVNEAIAPDVGRYPELTFPVELFRSDSAARRGGVYFNINMPGSPGPSARTATKAITRTIRGRGRPKIFIMMGPAALHREYGPVFTQRTLHHEYVHFLQSLRGELTERPACRAAWRGQRVPGNPNREIVAVSTTFARFFPAWADAARPDVTDYPHYLLEDLAFMQAYFPCVRQQLRHDAIARIVATVQGHRVRRRHFFSLIQDVRSRALPNIHLHPSDDAMARLSSAMGRPLPPEPRLPVER